MKKERKEINIKNICPVIGMISSGKSSILNSLFNMDFLEASSDVTTKIVTIIRYNKDIQNNPKFYKIELSKSSDDQYKFYKMEETEITGHDKIKEKIKNLNKDLKDGDPEYEDIFYMLEIGKAEFIQEHFLENYDIADIPGVSEHIIQKEKEENQMEHDNNAKNLFGNSEDAPNASDMSKSNAYYTPSTEEELSNYKVEKEINYLTQIFKIIKDRISCGIFIFSVDKFQLAENYKIVGKLKLILDKPIENYLILLNKMDISPNIEEDINLLKGRFVQEFPKGGFNITRNTIVPCSSFQLENELNMDKKFKNSLYYHYINCIMLSKNNITNFIEYLRDFLKNFLNREIESIEKETFENNIKSIKDKINLDDIKAIIQKININHYSVKNKLLLSESDFEKDVVNNCLSNLIKNDEGKIDLYEQTDNTILILYYYYLFSNKKITLTKSMQTQEILNYFTMNNMKRDFGYEEAKNKLQELENHETYNKKVDNLLKLIDDFEEKYTNLGINLNLKAGFKKSNKNIINALKLSKMLFIPVLGICNSGKSTILNNIIGDNLLPTKQGECTKKGILIKHWDYDIPIIRKAKFIVENTGNENDICYFKISDDILTQGKENVKNILKGLNCNYIEKEEDFFYIINVRIKFLEKFDEDDKEKICFIDLPGYGTKNKFEGKKIFSKFIKSCKIFLMISRDHFEDSGNVEKINNIIKNTSSYQVISVQSLIKKFLFVINPSKNLDLSENALIKKKNSLVKNINGLNENAFRDLNVTFLNALSCKEYISKKKYFNSINDLFRKEKKHYQKKKERFQKGQGSGSGLGKFENYFLNELKNKFKSTFDKNVNQISSKEIDQEIYQKIDESVNKFFEVEDNHFNETQLKTIKMILSFAKTNIEKCKYLNESNSSSFNVYLSYRIITSKYLAFTEFKKVIENNLDNLKTIFINDNIVRNGEAPVYIQIKKDADERMKEFKVNIENSIKDIQLDKINYDIPKVFENCIDNMVGSLKDLNSKIEQDLKRENWKEVLNNFENTFKMENDMLIEKIVTTLENFSDNIRKHYNESFQIINQFKNQRGNNYEIEEFKIYLSNHLGEQGNYREAIINIVNDILSNSRNATSWENSNIFEYFKCLFSSQAYLDKTTTFIMNNAYERLKAFRKNIFKIIDEYLEMILNKIDIEKNSLINHLTMQKQMEDQENERNRVKNDEERRRYEQIVQDEETKKNKWNMLCQEYNKLEGLIKDFLDDKNIPEYIVQENQKEKANHEYYNEGCTAPGPEYPFI